MLDFSTGNGRVTRLQEISEGLFDKSIITVVCRTCDHKNLRTVGWTKRNSDTECDRCGLIFPILKPESEHHETAVEHTMNSLREALRGQAPPPTPAPERRRFWRR